MATFKQINLHSRVQTAPHRTQKPETGVNLFQAPKKTARVGGKKNSIADCKSGRESMSKTGLNFT